MIEDYHTMKTKAGDILHCQGYWHLLEDSTERRIAVIGTRNPSERIIEKTTEVVEFLTKNDCITVSGLAIGVDTVAHTACIRDGGRTVAIPGSPLNNIYPSRNKGLAEEIVSTGGCVASPFDPGTKIEPYLFVRRNRVIARLSHAVVITGIAPMSGTFHVVWEAKKHGIPVFAIPVDPFDKLCGTNLLITRGDAILLQDWGQILEGAEARIPCNLT